MTQWDMRKWDTGNITKNYESKSIDFFNNIQILSGWNEKKIKPTLKSLSSHSQV